MSVGALTRFDADPYRPPNEWFDGAWSVGLGPQLENITAKAAIQQTSKLDEGVSLAINASPATLTTPELFEVFAGNRGGLIVEVTEHATVEDIRSSWARWSH